MTKEESMGNGTALYFSNWKMWWQAMDWYISFWRSIKQFDPINKKNHQKKKKKNLNAFSASKVILVIHNIQFQTIFHNMSKAGDSVWSVYTKLGKAKLSCVAEILANIRQSDFWIYNRPVWWGNLWVVLSFTLTEVSCIVLESYVTWKKYWHMLMKQASSIKACLVFLRRSYMLLYCEFTIAICYIHGWPKKPISSLQLIWNAATFLLTNSKRQEDITPVLPSLQWLPVSFRADFWITNISSSNTLVFILTLITLLYLSRVIFKSSSSHQIKPDGIQRSMQCQAGTGC